MSRFLRSLLCRIWLHQWQDFDYQPWMDASGLWCTRCGAARSWSQLGLQNPSSPAPTSSLSLVDRLSRPAIERAARRAGTADTEAPVPEATPEGSTQPQDQRSESGTGAVDPYWWLDPAVVAYKYGSLTGAPAQEAASSTSTPTPSPGSPRSHAGSSR